MRLDVRCDIDLGDLEHLAREFPETVDRAVRKTVFQIQRYAQDHVPVDTGALKASIYAVTSKTNGMAQAIGAMKARNQDAGVASGLPTQAQLNEAWLVCAAEYGMFIEYGTMHRRGNTKKLGNRSGRIGVSVAQGETPHYERGFYTLQPGYLFMTDAANYGRRVFRDNLWNSLHKVGAV